MRNEFYRCRDGQLSKDPWDVTGERIPEIFPTKQSLLKTVCLGLAVTLLQFGILTILIIKPWR